MSVNLPAALDSERAILGGALLSRDVLAEISPLVEPADFHHPVHAAIFAAMLSLDAASAPVDFLSVYGRMESDGTAHRLAALGREGYLASLTSEALTDGAGWHARRVRAKSQRRRWVEIAQGIVSRGLGDGEDDEFFAAAEGLMSGMQAGGGGDDYRTIRQVLKSTYDLVEDRYSNKRMITGVPSGFEQLDERTGGFQPGHLIVVGGRAKMGKTALAMCSVQHAAGEGQRLPCLVFSLEMGETELGARLASSEGGVDGQRLRNGFLEQADWIHFARACGSLADAPIHVYDRPATFPRIRSIARRWRAREAPKGLGLIVVDYLGLIQSDPNRPKGQNREQEISAWSRGFKLLAKELGVPVILLAQLNRELERRPDKRPVMSDLRESGAIEQDADMVLFVYRDEVYNAASTHRGIAELIIGANRHGPAGMVYLRFEGEYTRFSDVALSSVPPPEQSRPRRAAGARYAPGDDA